MLQQQYGEFSKRNESNYTQSLWHVNDAYVARQEDRFLPDTAPFMEHVMDGGVGPLEGAPIPKGLILFVEDFCRMFGCVPSRFTSSDQVIGHLMSFLDYTEPYYLLVDSLITVTANAMIKTYKYEKSGSVLPPDEIEVFEVQRGYDFPAFRAATDIMDHQGTKLILNGQTVTHKLTGKPVTKLDVLEKLSEVLWGNPGWLRSHIDDWLFSYYEEVQYGLKDGKESDDEMLNWDSIMQQDAPYWMVSTIAALMWFRSPYAVKFLIDCHPIYWSVLNWDERENKLKIREKSGGEAIVHGWDVYTHAHLIVEANVPPGTCCNCGQTLHCSKFVNVTAIKNPICSCGKPIALELNKNFERYWDHSHADCEQYMRAYPPLAAFVCQRCLHTGIKNLSKDTGCGRTKCPNTKCAHHVGQAAYIREMTKARLALPHFAG